MTTSRKDILALIIILSLLTIWLRMPTVRSGMPYFSHEDEAHHFNRTVRIVQSGDWNPHYFHKPSFHFYLRAPIVAASFLSEVRRGNIRKIQEIQTRDNYGLAGYALTASHPAIAKWNRAFSLLMAVGTILFAFLIVIELTGSLLIATIAALISSFSPSLYLHSATIGVDVPMSLLCIASVYFALLTRSCPCFPRFFGCGLLAGLAISTKYNALPIAIVPFLALVYKRKIYALDLFVAGGSVALGFLLGSPYILAEFPLFLNQFAYEIWHYGIAGHVGHTAEPGLEQLLFYLSWLSGDGIGIMAAALIPFGIYFSMRKRLKETIVTLAFPLLFFTLMVMQRANFTRNMIVFIPFAAIFAAMAFEVITEKIAAKKNLFSLFIPGLLLCIILVAPAYRTFTLRSETISTTESRTDAIDWLEKNTISEDTAFAGELGIPHPIAERGKRSRVGLSGMSGSELALQGFKRVVSGNLKEALTGIEKYYSLTKSFDGVEERQRVPINPAIQIYETDTNYYTAEPLPEAPTIYLSEESPISCGKTLEGMKEAKEGHCWINYHQAKLQIKKEAGVPGFIAVSAMSPWSNQKLSFLINDKREEFELKAGEWQRIVLNISPQEIEGSFISIHTFLSEVHAPSDLGSSRDIRRLGVAIKEITLQ